ncbi:MAG TPA: putative DNA-binding domain-containing protein [Polyangiaceae bacterium]|jgi:hypothetical protein|nr:putative DNA-binding domain-containing protein [Polyangiaceae bacterium]
MTEAALIQAHFAEFLRRRRDLTRDEAARRFAGEHLGGNARLSPVEQLEIYREQFWLRHTHSLVEDFPGVGGILGQADWDRLVWDYLETVAPTSYDLGDLGMGLPAFIATRDWLEQRELVFDMATLEAHHVAVFSAPDRAPLDPQKLATVPEDAWDRARLVPDPALRLQRVSYPVVALRRRLVAERDEPTGTPLALPAPETSLFAVHRRQRLIFHDVLEPLAFALLQAIVRGDALGPACEAVAATAGVPLETLGANLERWFADWAGRGYLVDVMI